MAQPHGITRSRWGVRPTHVRGVADPHALADDVRALRDAVADLSKRLDESESRIVRRVNEMILSGPIAERPAAGVADRLFFSTDTPDAVNATFDTGTEWVSFLTATVFRRSVPAGDRTATFNFASLGTANYIPLFSTNWATIVRWSSRTATQLVATFSVVAPPNAQLLVAIL